MTDSGRYDIPDDQTPDTPTPFPQEIEPAPSPAVQVTMDQMTDRLQTVIDAAERAAEAIRFDAETQARQHLAEAQQKADRLTAERVRLIAELTDDLIDHASVVKQHSEQMVGALEQAIQSVSGRIDEVTGEVTPEAPETPTETPSPPPAPFGAPGDPFALSVPEPLTEPPPAPEAEPVAEPAPSTPPGAEVHADEVTAASGAPEVLADDAYREPALPESESPALDAPEIQAQPEPEIQMEPEPEVESHPEPEVADVIAEPEPVPEVETFLAAAEPPPEALLRATQLAVAGSERGDVAEMLTREYGIDPAPVLDRIFGPA